MAIPTYEASYSLTPWGMFQLAIGKLGFTTETLAVDDDIINDVTFDWTINANGIEYCWDVAERAIGTTLCYVRPKAASKFEAIYPQAADATDKTYYDYQAPYFYHCEGAESLWPWNRVIVHYNEGADKLWTAAASEIVNDATQQGKTDVIALTVFAGELDSAGDANARGEAYLAKGAASAYGGYMIVNFDPEPEVYDNIKGVERKHAPGGGDDNTYPSSNIVRANSIVYKFNRQAGEYSTTFYWGGLATTVDFGDPEDFIPEDPLMSKADIVRAAGGYLKDVSGPGFVIKGEPDRAKIVRNAGGFVGLKQPVPNPLKGLKGLPDSKINKLDL